MKKRVLSWILVLTMILALMPAAISVSAAEQEELEAPSSTDYRFNGHWVTDRSNFRLILADWTLVTYTDAPALITTGASSGVGMSYCENLGEAWYGKVTVSLSTDDEAGLHIGSDKPLVVTLKTVAGALTVKVTHNDQTLYEKAVGNAGDITVVVDNTLGAQSLKLYLYAGENYLTGVQLSNLDSDLQNVLEATDRIAFYATKTGTTFTDFAINDMIYKYSNDPAAALAKVEAMVKAEVEGSIVYADNGVPMYTPDGVQSYNALWTRDFNYVLEYAGDYVPLDNAIACIEYLLENVHEGDCWLPDRVEGSGNPVYAAGSWAYSYRNLDNNSFIVISLDCVLDRMGEAEGKALFEKWEGTLMTALDSLPKDENGLIWNDPQNPHSPYGFTDCIAKTGTLMKESLLLWRAYSIMAKWQTAYGKDASVATEGAKKIENSLVNTFKNADGMLDAATVDCHQTDVWGSCYAVSIGFPMEESLKKSIADYLANNYDGLVQMGQLRHTAPGTYWGRLLAGVGQGEYQNGAYWGTPTGWLVDALVEYYPDLAMVTVQDVITYYEEVGIYECVNGDYKKLNHYAASASNILPAVRKMLTADMESVTIKGDDKAATGATKQYTAVAVPGTAKAESYAWTVNGESAGNQSELSVTFPTAGEYVLECVVTDIAGNTAKGSLTVTVTDGVYDGITMTAEGIVGKKGDVVTISYTVDEGSMLAFADLEIHYDPKIMVPHGEQYGVAAGALWDGVVVGNKVSDGTLVISMAAATPVEQAGGVLTVTFELLSDVKETAYAMPEVKLAKADYLDDTGVHTVDVTVQEGEPVNEPSDTGDHSMILAALAAAVVSGMGTVALIHKKRRMAI